VISLYKKESRKNLGNYTGISVTILNRSFAKIIHNKLQETSKHIISEIQNGFSPDREFMVQQRKEQHKRVQTHMTLIDLEKSYDLIPKTLM